MLWLQKGRPTGTGALGLLDERINGAWRLFLEEKGFADVLWARLANESN